VNEHQVHAKLPELIEAAGEIKRDKLRELVYGKYRETPKVFSE